MQISSNINSISTISWILWHSRGPPHDDVIICKLDEYIYTPHKLPQALEILVKIQHLKKKIFVFFYYVIYFQFISLIPCCDQKEICLFGVFLCIWMGLEIWVIMYFTLLKHNNYYYYYYFFFLMNLCHFITFVFYIYIFFMLVFDTFFKCIVVYPFILHTFVFLNDF